MADKKKKIKSPIKKNLISSLLEGTTLGGGIGVQDTEYETIPSATLNLTKGKTTVEGSVAKGFSKVDDQNINSQLGLNIIRQGDKGSGALQFTKSGKDKYVGFQFSKTFGGTKKRKGGKVKEAYLGSFIEGGPGSNKTYRKYYKGMI